MLSNPLRLIPLGGLGEIGRNMMVLEYDKQLIVIDVGLMFPDNDMLGVDVVIPDMSYVIERAEQIEGIVITHGHEDHIGALSYLLTKVDAPVYATRFTIGLIEGKLREAGIDDAELIEVAAGQELLLGPFKIEFFAVSHSIPDGVGMGIQTPVGLIVHSGDFKLDHTPVDGHKTDFAKLAELGQRGVRLLLSDSTNSETAGYTPSEQVLGESISHIFGGAAGRIIVATFASNISRVQQVINIARRYGRKVGVVGRSMVSNVRLARSLGYLEARDDELLDLESLRQLPDEQVVLVCTGSQGEPTSALVRMGAGQYRAVSIEQGDTIIVSASPIPGNEESINRTLDNLFRLGAQVFYDELSDVHVSGHASQEEQKMLLSLVRPEYFVPIHGEYRHLVLHANLAAQCGVARDKIFVLETGDVLELDQSQVCRGEPVCEGHVLVDGRGFGGSDQRVLADRQTLANHGFWVMLINVDKYTGGLVGEPRVISRGFSYDGEHHLLTEQAKQEIEQALSWRGTTPKLEERLTSVLGKLFSRETGRHPIVVPVINRV